MPSLPSAPFFGQNTDVDATAERLSPTTVPVYTGAVIINTSSSDFIYIGSASNVSATTGFPIPPLTSQPLDVGLIPLNSNGVADLHELYVCGGATNIAVGYMGR